MHDGTLRSLEFDRIVELVRGLALTPLGAAELGKLRPQTDPRSVQATLSATSEGSRYLESNPPFGLHAPADLDQTLTALAIEGHAPEPEQLLGLADFLASVATVRQAVAGAEGGPFPALRTILEGCRPFDREIDEIRSKIDPTDGVVDQASPELKTIRARLRKQRDRLRGTLDSYLRGRETAKYLQEQVVTERNGRYVLVVRAEHRNSIPGIVHGSSSSGASLFLEPLSTVEINNDIVALEQDEHAEVFRILLALATGLRTRALDLRGTLTAATEIDVVQARATFSRLIDGVEPTLSTDARVEFLEARHPLLIPAVRDRLRSGARGESVGAPVPNDIRLAPPDSAVVVTGPNTGGKTVALKTAGLLALMTQAGLHVPAAPGSKTTVFRTVFADIGDEQSIAANLSTFSAHISSIVALDRRLGLPALVLLDEIGAGTAPVEGGALGAALIEHFRQRGALTMVTTHNDTLKSYASTTPGVACAGFGFDPDSFAPTYRLTYGTPGRSLALEIASRLGMTESVIAAARARRSEREAQLADHLAKIDDDLRRLEADRRQLETERDTVERDRRQLAEQRRTLEEREARAKQRLSGGIESQVRAARAEIDAVVEKLRAKASELEHTATVRVAAGQVGLSTGDTGTLRADARAAVEAAASRAHQAAGTDPLEAAPPTTPIASGPAPGVGSRVVVGALGVVGTVLALHEGQAEVDVRGKRLRIATRDLAVTESGGAPPEGAGGGGVTLDVARSDALADLNLIGCTVEDAQTRIEKYLDQAVLGEHRQVRIIHGHGTGQLRRATRELLAQHPHVERFEVAPAEQGGDGATVVALKE